MYSSACNTGLKSMYVLEYVDEGANEHVSTQVHA